MAANRSTIGAAVGTIIPTIITAHIRNMNPKSAMVQDRIWAIIMPWSMPPMSRAK